MADKAVEDEDGGRGEKDGMQSKDEGHTLNRFREKAMEMLDLFEELGSNSRMEGLDVLQDLVSATITKMTNGQFQGVKFVPVTHIQGGTRLGLKTEETGNTTVQPNDPPINSQSSEPAEGENDQLESNDPVIEPKPEDAEDDSKDNVNSINGNLPEVADKSAAEFFQESTSLTADSFQTGTDDVTPEPGRTLGIILPRSSRKAAQRANQKILQATNSENTGEEIKQEEEDDYMPPLQPKSKPQHSSKQELKCRYCTYESTTSELLEAHHTTVHSGARVYQCEYCLRAFSAVASLKRHKHTHSGMRNHQCLICNKEFYTITDLKTHSVVHTGIRNYACKECNKAFTCSANLARHRRIHTGETPYACTLCDVKYRDMASLKLHTLKHTGEKPYQCSVCNKKFKTSSDYRRHERIHTNERNYECSTCGQKFIQGWHLKMHLKVHTNERPWSCDRCPGRFRTKAALQYHIKSHLGIKDFQCHTCLKSFSTKTYLQAHMVTHTTQKPYKCSLCTARFNQYCNMKRHEKQVHSDKRLFRCNMCFKEFKYQNSLDYHVKLHEKTTDGKVKTRKPKALKPRENTVTEQVNDVLVDEQRTKTLKEKGKKVCEKCGLGFRSKMGFQRHKCDPLKYGDNVMKTVSMENLVIKLEPIKEVDIEVNGSENIISKESENMTHSEKSHSDTRKDLVKSGQNAKMPKIVLKINKKNLEIKSKKKAKIKHSKKQGRITSLEDGVIQNSPTESVGQLDIPVGETEAIEPSPYHSPGTLDSKTNKVELCTNGLSGDIVIHSPFHIEESDYMEGVK